MGEIGIQGRGMLTPLHISKIKKAVDYQNNYFDYSGVIFANGLIAFPKFELILYLATD